MVNSLVKDDEVILNELPTRSIKRLKVGMKGIVLAARPHVDSQILVKFEGVGSPISVYLNELIRRNTCTI